MISPRAMSRLIPSRTRRPPYLTTTSRTEMIGSNGDSGIWLLPHQQVKRGRESQVRQDDQESGFHYSRGRRPSHCVRAAAYPETLQAADMHDDGGERQALSQPQKDISQHDRMGHVPEV